MKQVLGREQPKIIELARSDKEMEEVEADADAGMAGRLYEHRGRFQVVDERILRLKLKCNFDAVSRRRLACLLQRDLRTLDVDLAERPQKIGDNHKHGY